MKKLIVIFLALLISFTLCACGKSDLCGKWYSPQDENTVTFDEKGGFKLQFWDGDSVKGTFTVDKQEEYDGILRYTVTLRDSKGGKQSTLITVDGDQMTLSNAVYKRQ